MYAQYQVALLKELDKLEVSAPLKLLVKGKAKEVEQRVYWFSTVEEESSFLEQYWQNQVQGDIILKNRIVKITDDKLNELFEEINAGKIENESTHELEVSAEAISKIRDMSEDVPYIDHKYFSKNHPKTKEAQEKVKRLHEEEHEFKQRIARIKQKEEEKRKEREALDEEIKRSLEKEKRQKYREHVFKTLEEKKSKQKEREEQSEKFKEFLKVFKSSKPMHVLMEEEYHQKFVLPQIEEKNKKLQQFSTIAKPTLQEINEHDRNFMEAINTRDSTVLIAHQTIDVFKSRFYQEEQRRMLQRDEFNPLEDQMERKKRYSEIVKQNFKPKVSRALRESINESTLKNSTARESLDRNELVERGKLYLQYMRSLQKNRQSHISASEKSGRDRQKIQSLYQSRYANYLEGLKESRQVVSNDSNIGVEWERDFKNKSLGDVERRERILLKSKQLEEKAYRQEQFVSNYTFGKPEEIIEKKKEIDNKIISSIRAKVAILRDAQKQA